MLKIALPASLAVFCVSLVGSYAAETGAVIRQKDRRFDQSAVTISRGEAIHFTNEDEFLHQIYVDTSRFSFDSNEQSPGENVGVTFTTPGVFEVRCGIHPRMRLEVTVED